LKQHRLQITQELLEQPTLAHQWFAIEVVPLEPVEDAVLVGCPEHVLKKAHLNHHRAFVAANFFFFLPISLENMFRACALSITEAMTVVAGDKEIFFPCISFFFPCFYLPSLEIFFPCTSFFFPCLNVCTLSI
jgi:hypothetical protein